MTERILFHFDPICPWCYRTAPWVWRLEELGAVEPDWGLFSRELRHPSVAELKRDRDEAPDLEPVRQWQTKRAEQEQERVA